jgi:predicted transcriptional regulator
MSKGQAVDAPAQDVIRQYLGDEAHFIAAVTLGEEALDSGDYLTHEQLGKHREQLFNF